MTIDQITFAARGLYVLRLAQDNNTGNFIDLPDFEQDAYYAKGERILYDLGEEAVERIFQ